MLNAFDGTIAIVGGAPEWDKKTAYGCDVVLRVNDNWVRQGGRMDAVYTRETAPRKEYASLMFAAFDMEADTDEWLSFCGMNGLHYFQFDCQRYVKRSPYPWLEWCNEFCWSIETLPFTGVMAVAHMLSLVKPEQLFVTGFTFFATNGVMPRAISTHKIPSQVKYLQSAKARGVVMDAPLSLLLSNPVYGEAVCL